MSANAWIFIGILVGTIGGAFSAFAIPYGFHLKSEESKIEAFRREAKAKTSENQVAIFQIINNKYVFQEVKTEKNPIQKKGNGKHRASIIFSPHDFNVDTSFNISGITDNGSGDITLAFDQDFTDTNYYANITGDNLTPYDIVKRKGSLSFKFDEEKAKKIQVICTQEI